MLRFSVLWFKNVTSDPLSHTHSVALTPEYVVTAGADQFIRVWSVESLINAPAVVNEEQQDTPQLLQVTIDPAHCTPVLEFKHQNEDEAINALAVVAGNSSHLMVADTSKCATLYSNMLQRIQR